MTLSREQPLRRRIEPSPAKLLGLLKSKEAHPERGVPLHQVIRRQIERLLASRMLKPGDQIPTEQELMAVFSVSRITVRQALAQLVTSGAVVAKPGKGTFVAQPPITHQLKRLTGFVEDMEALGIAVVSKVVRISEVRANTPQAEKLRIKEGAGITRIERLRLANDEPLSFDISHMPADIGRRIAAENLRTDPIFSLLENKYGIKLAEADYSIGASLADTAVARHLQVKRGSPILLIERTTYSTSGSPVDYEVIYYRGDRIRYMTTLKR